jgi:hypothetical protein
MQSNDSCVGVLCNDPSEGRTEEEMYGENDFDSFWRQKQCICSKAFFSYRRKPFSDAKKPCYEAASKEGWRQKSEYTVAYKIRL